MPLIASISGIRGTIGGVEKENLTPPDVVRFTASYAQWLLNQGAPPTVVVGRDARRSGPQVHSLVCATLSSIGLHVLDAGLTTTPTLALAITWHRAGGGIMLTASHNPENWNALKLMGPSGEFISEAAGQEIIALYHQGAFRFAAVDDLGTISALPNLMTDHLNHIAALPLVDAPAIRQRNFHVVVDAVNSSGGIYVPALLRHLGVQHVTAIHAEPNGYFAHNPEPLDEHLGDLKAAVVAHQADLGIAVDPDVDRLVLVDEQGKLIGEEYTLVLVADYVLRHTPGPTVSNLSSSRALADLTARYGQSYHPSAVGEVNVVKRMKEVGAPIGGEGNGGIIYPPTHYGRDALVGIALALSLLAHEKRPLSEIRAAFPQYVMVKDKVALPEGTPLADVFSRLQQAFSHEATPNTLDGLKLDWPHGWVHLRKSNTEPIIRLYAEAAHADEAAQLVRRVKEAAGL